MKACLWTILVLIIAGVSAGLSIVYMGTYNVAATQHHTEFTRWLFSTTMKNSVRSQAADIDAPELTDDMAEAGFGHYDAQCKLCHGAPGVEPGHMAQGMRPSPPDLSRTIERWKPAEVFWIIKHGVRMTGMPAWTVGYDDQVIWQTVAFTRRLPHMAASDYQSRVQQLEEEDDGGHDATGGTRHTVEMTNSLEFQPSTLTIEVGDTVTWKNTSDVVHTVTADAEQASDPAHVRLPSGASAFNSGDIPAGSSFERRFAVAGRYRYFCIPHESARMVGELIVEQP